MPGELKMTDEMKQAFEAPQAPPADFVTDKEHPVLPIPFTAKIGDYKLEGCGLSLVAAHVKVPVDPDPTQFGTKYIATLLFQFEGFGIELHPEVRIAEGDAKGQVKMVFVDPTGAHLPQLRYIINSFIAGDFVTLGSMLSYSGPVKPKSPKAKAAERGRNYVRSAGMVLLSIMLILVAFNTLSDRFTNAYEPRPVFVVRDGNEMRATSPGQITYLNPDARKGEIVYSIAANTGDVLNLQLPCDCDVMVEDGVYEGATVLPGDPILTFFDNSFEVSVKTQMSVEGLARAVNGDQAYLDMSDGRSVPVKVHQTTATSDAAQRGDLYLPVTLIAPKGALKAEDIGKPARLRLERKLFDLSFFKGHEQK